MQENMNIPTLLNLRKLTKAISSFLEQELKSYLAALTPSFNPGLILGEHIQGVKQTAKGSSETFKALLDLYRSLRNSKRFSGRLTEIKPPIPVFGKSLEITAVEYDYEAKDESGTKIIRMRSPLKWYLGYRDQGIKTLRELLAAPARSGDTSLEVCALHHLVMHFFTANESGAAKILNVLRFDITSQPSAELGGLPLATISSPVSTVCPPDELIIQSTELSGNPLFEEVVNIDDIDQLHDPLNEKLADIAKGHRDQ